MFSQYLPYGLNEKGIDKFCLNSIECNSIEKIVRVDTYYQVDNEYHDKLNEFHYLLLP